MTTTRPDPDQHLVQRARGGDFAAFEALATRYQRPIYNLARRILRHPQDSEEVVQDTFLSAIEHIRQFHGESAFYTWLVRIATNHALKLLEKRRRRSAVPLQPGDGDNTPLPHPNFVAPWRQDPARLAEDAETRQLLAEALDEIDEKYRLVFLLRDVQELSTEETAEAMGISIANVKVRLLRARLMLRERLTERFGDPNQRVATDHAHHDVTSAPKADRT